MLYPLRFRPLFRQYLWGGRRLETSLGKSIGPGDHYAESWEIVDHGADQCVVEHGPLAGQTLRQLVVDHGEALFGQHHPQSQFPLLFKFLDANRDLSVQVHPNDAQGALLDPPDLGKTEAWVIIDAEPGSKIYSGLKQGTDRAALSNAISSGSTATCLHHIEPNIGDCIFIPAGTVHAIGAGLLVAEIQQASNTTFRLFDWNRVDTNGLPRPLHVDSALDVIDYDRGPVDPQVPVETSDPDIVRLVKCDKFVLDRWSFSRVKPLGDDDRFHILAVLDGGVTIQDDPAAAAVRRGQTVLVPACVGNVKVTPIAPTIMLDAYLP